MTPVVYVVVIVVVVAVVVATADVGVSCRSRASAVNAAKSLKKIARRPRVSNLCPLRVKRERYHGATPKPFFLLSKLRYSVNNSF